MKKDSLSLCGASVCGGATLDRPDYTTGTPWLDCDLAGNVTEETQASLKDHFALAVNKDRILKIVIPKGYPSGGTMTDLGLQNVEDTKKMFLGKAPAAHDAKLAYDLFWLMMDWEGRNARGIDPLKRATDAIEAIDSVDALTAYFLETPPEEQLASLWDFSPAGDFKDSSRFILAFAWNENQFLLKDSAEYGKLTDYGRIKKEAVIALAKKMLVKLGYTEAEAMEKIDNCFAFEALIAPVIPTSEQMQSPEFYANIYHIYSRDEVKAAQDKVPVLEKLTAEGFPEAERYLVTVPVFLSKLNELYTRENLPLIRDYMIVHAAVDAAGNLDRECYEWKIEYSNALSGAIGILPDADVFAPVVAKALEWPVARLYSDTYLKQADKDRICALVDKIIETYHGIIEEASFLSDATKAKAIEKLETIDKNILFPDSWEKYECPELNFPSREEGGTLWQALARIKAYRLAESVKEYGKPVDKKKWVQTPNTVNCGYVPTRNAVNILGGFTQGKIYSGDMSDEAILGTLGWVIGHEISHAFDSSGAKFDKDGNMNQWWTDEDFAAFKKRNEKMEAYYNAMHPWAGQDFYGRIMTGEGCADMGGMKVVLRIAAQKEGFDYDTLFRTLCLVWMEKGSLQAAYSQINDVHPMGYLRVNGTLQQFDDFLDFYGIKEGDGMYLAPEDRVAIW